MNGIEFIKMMKQDIATVSGSSKHDLEAVVEVMEFVVKQEMNIWKVVKVT